MVIHVFIIIDWHSATTNVENNTFIMAIMLKNIGVDIKCLFSHQCHRNYDNFDGLWYVLTFILVLCDNIVV